MRTSTGRVLFFALLLAASTAHADNKTTKQPVGERQAMVIVHGIGNQKEGDYKAFKDAIRAEFEREVQRLTGNKPPQEALSLKTALWANITQSRQDQYIKEVGKKYGGTLPTYNQLLVEMGGDALMYSRNGTKGIRMQNEVKRDILDLAKEAKGQKVALHLVAHSLGTLVSSDAMRKMTHESAPQRDATGSTFDQAKMPGNVEWAHFVTIGGPLALGRDDDDVKTPLKPRKWTNIIYPRDGVGTDLMGNDGKPLAGMKEFAGVKELRLGSAGHRHWLTRAVHRLISRTPWVGAASHVFYWTDPSVQKAIAHEMAHRYVKSLGPQAKAKQLRVPRQRVRSRH
ncbi:MAG: hypothetical protein KC503_17640 [Myxococcales bacterium]|nr:hypothetical protein [Myxococcales bacterium]